MIPAITPLGTATGTGWQYQLEREGIFSTWQNWSADFNFDADPEDGLEIRRNVTYWLYARNPLLPSTVPGSFGNELAASLQVTNTNTVVSVTPDGTVDTPAISPTLGIINAPDSEKRAVLTDLLAAGRQDTDIAGLICELVQLSGCGGGPTDPNTPIGPFVATAHDIEVDDTPVGPQPTGQYRIVNSGGSTTLTMNEGGTLQLILQQKYSNEQWQIDTQARTVSLLNAITGATLSSSELITVPPSSISADTGMGVRYVLTASGITIDAGIMVLNNAPAGSAPTITNPITDQNITSSGDTTLILATNYFTGATSVTVLKLAGNGVDTESLPAGVSYDAPNRAITILASVNTNFVMRITGINQYGSTPSEKLFSFNRPVAPTVISRRIDQTGVGGQLIEGGSPVEFHVTEVMSNGTDRPYTGAGIGSVDAPYPNGLQILTGNGSTTLSLPDDTISADVPLTHRFTFPSGSGLPDLTIPFTAVNHNNAPIAFVPPTNFWSSYDFTLFPFYDENGQPSIYFDIEGGYWGQYNGGMCQQQSVPAVVNSIILTGNNQPGDAYYLDSPDTAILFSVSDSTANSNVGVGLRVSSSVNTGYALQLLGNGTIGLTDIAVNYGPTVPYSILPNKLYYMRLRYEETGTDTATVKGKIWKQTEAEPTDYQLVWENQPRRSGFPAMLGSSNGTTIACYNTLFAESLVTP